MSIPGCRDKGSVGIDKGTVYTFNAAGEYGNPASGTTTWTYMGPEFDVVAPEIPFEDGTRNGSKVYVVEKSELAPGSGMYMYGASDWLTLDGNVISGENVLVETEYTLKAGSNPDSGLRSGARTAEILILPADIAHGVSSVDDLFEEGSFGAADLKAEYRDYITATVNQDAPSGVFSARDLASAAKNGDAFRTMEYSNPEDQTAMDAIDPDGTIRYLYRMTYTTEWSNVELNYDPSYESCFTKENLPKCVRAFTSEGIGHPMDDPWASVEAIEAVSGGDGEPMTAPAFRISMGSAESAKSCFLVFYDTNQTPLCGHLLRSRSRQRRPERRFRSGLHESRSDGGRHAGTDHRGEHEPDRRRIRRERRNGGVLDEHFRGGPRHGTDDLRPDLHLGRPEEHGTDRIGLLERDVHAVGHRLAERRADGRHGNRHHDEPSRSRRPRNGHGQFHGRLGRNRMYHLLQSRILTDNHRTRPAARGMRAAAGKPITENNVYMKLFKSAVMLTAGLAMGFLAGCSDDDGIDNRDRDYGYVQFRLYKEASYDSSRTDEPQADAFGRPGPGPSNRSSTTSPKPARCR